MFNFVLGAFKSTQGHSNTTFLFLQWPRWLDELEYAYAAISGGTVQGAWRGCKVDVHVMNYEILEPFSISRARGVLNVCNWEAETEDTAPT